MSTFLSIPNNFDMLALSSASSSSISSSTSSSSLFESHRTCSSSSQTDVSLLASLSNEDVNECTNGPKCSFWDSSWKKDRLKTPIPTLKMGISSLELQESHRLPKVRSRSLTEEAGYEAEASDGDESSAFVLLKNRKKKLVRPRVRSEYRIEPIVGSEGKEERPKFRPPIITRWQDEFIQNEETTPPKKPLIRPLSQNLNSPSPIIALPSAYLLPPILKPHPSFISVGHISTSLDTISERLHRVRGLRKGTQKPLGLGLHVPGVSESCSVNSFHSIETNILSDQTRPATILCPSQVVKEKEVAMIGLGIQLPLDLPLMSPSVETGSTKRRSFSRLGHGLPSIRYQGLDTQLTTTILSSHSTIRLVTPSDCAADSILQMQDSPQVTKQDLDVDLLHQRRAAISLSQDSFSNFPKRHLYPIFESPTNTTAIGITAEIFISPSTVSNSSSFPIKKPPFSTRPENEVDNSYNSKLNTMSSSRFDPFQKGGLSSRFSRLLSHSPSQRERNQSPFLSDFDGVMSNSLSNTLF